MNLSKAKADMGEVGGRLRSVMVLITVGLQMAFAGNYAVSIDGEQILLNGQPFTVKGLRCSNALVTDAPTDSLINNLALFKSYGINSVSVYFMGSRFGDVKGFQPDSRISTVHAERMARIIEAADNQGMMVLVGCLYWGTSDAKKDLNWSQSDANAAVANVVNWLKEKGYRNVIVDPDNEGMSPFNINQMIQAGHAADPDANIANNGTSSASDADLNIHFGPRESGKPYFDSEGTVGTPMGGYWTTYSKESFKESKYYNYSRIGRYTAEMKTSQKDAFIDGVEKENGYMVASTWLQCGPGEGVNGPFMSPGGHSNIADVNANIDDIHPDAGVLWLLEHLKNRYGAWEPPSTSGNSAPVASFSADPASGTPPHTVSLNASASSDRDNDALTYSWDLGDGTTATGKTASHTYEQVGTYSVVLTVSDGTASSTSTKSIVVSSDVQQDPLTIVGATAGAEESGNPAINAFDGDLATRWANDGTLENAWIEFDLATNATVGGMHLVTQKNTRSYPISISAGGTELWSENVTDVTDITFAPVQTSSIRVTLTAANSDGGNWLSIKEVSLLGESGTPVEPPPVTPPVTGDGIVEVNGLVSMEAEHATRIKNWIPIQMGSNDSTMIDDGGGYMEFDITFSKTGTYIIWVHNLKDALKDGTCASDQCNDCFAQMDGKDLFIYEGSSCDGSGGHVIGLGTHATSLTWQSRPKTHCGGDRSGKHVAFTITNTGLNTFRIGSRSDKYGIDKLVFMHEDLGIEKPSGNGPAETLGTTGATRIPDARSIAVRRFQKLPASLYDVSGRLITGARAGTRNPGTTRTAHGIYIHQAPSGQLERGVRLK